MTVGIVGRNLPDDGLHHQEIKSHSLEKYRRHCYVTSQFANGMKNKWPQRAYIGLYAGAGRAKIEGTGEIVETPALSVLRQPFTHYIFVDNDSVCMDALEKRVAALQTGHKPEFIPGDVNERIEDIKKALPPYGRSNGLLSFCFVDPFSAELNFKTIRSLATFQMDFLILLALGHDVLRNFWEHYYWDRSNSRIADLLDCPSWREQFVAAGGRNIVRFILKKFDEAMVKIGYQSPKPEHHCAIKSSGRLLYYLVLYSKHPLGLTFWENTQAGLTTQLDLGLSF
jgi:three-Cys-motif partner protein